MADPLAPPIPAIAAGDTAALARLHRELERPLYRFVLSRLTDPQGSADLLDDVFMEVWRSAGRFEGRSKVQTWIFGITWRKVMDLRRKGARVDLPGETPDMVDDAPDGEAAPRPPTRTWSWSCRPCAPSAAKCRPRRDARPVSWAWPG